MPTPGDPAPWFVGRTSSKARFHFDTIAGRYVVLCFFASTRLPPQAAILRGFHAARSRFDDKRACFFGITVDPGDRTSELTKPVLPGVRFFFDFDREISAQFELCEPNRPGQANEVSYAPRTIILDSRLRVLAVFDMNEPESHCDRVLNFLDQLPALETAEPNLPQAPVLIVPRVFEPEFCRMLIGTYLAEGGTDSGFMRDVDGKTKGMIDHRHKRRSDCFLREDRHGTLIAGIRERLFGRLMPEVQRAFQFAATRIERYVVACYDADTGGYFRAHRDNTSRGTSHRRFAVSINLNAEEFTGCDLRFPEYGARTYRPPTGGAVVFSCSLLHEATQVSSGQRYACLPFLYDEAGEAIRRNNRSHVEADVAHDQRSAASSTGAA